VDPLVLIPRRSDDPTIRRSDDSVTRRPATPRRPAEDPWRTGGGPTRSGPLGRVGAVAASKVSGNASAEHEVRPWGSFTVLEDAPGHKVKRLEVLPGYRLSYQRHARRAEHWFVLVGQAAVTLDDAVHHLGAGDAIDVPRGAAHRIANQADVPLVFIEVQHGDYFGEDDIERLEDDFGRVG